MNCESCNNLHDGTYGSGRFCNTQCAKTFSSKVKRKEANEKISNSLKGKTSPKKGRKFSALSEEHKEKIKKGIKEHWDNTEKVSDEHKRHKNVTKVAKYRTRKINALPEDANLFLISLIYKYCPKGYHVDHIHSLATGGVHHEDNLQYLPASENCRKCADREYDKSLAIDWRTIVKVDA